MKGYIKEKTIVLDGPLPPELKEGERVEVLVIPVTKKHNFPTFQLGVKDEAVNRESIYERD